MHELLLDYLACPACGGDLRGSIHEWDGEEAMEGSLDCQGCGSAYALVRGVPRMNTAMSGLENVARTFGYEWRSFHEGEFEDDTVFGRTPDEDWSYFLEGLGVAESDLEGKVVLDAGCGSGRLTRQIGEHGAGIVIGVDINDAVEHVYRSTRDAENVHIVQGNIMQLPFKRHAFDLVWSNGVIHHTPSAAACHRALTAVVKPGGTLYVWVYARRFSPFKLAKDVADRIGVSKLPEPALLALCRVLAYPSLALLRLYRACVHLPFVRRTPWLEWTSRRRTLKELRLTWFDTLSPQYDTTHTEPEVIGWFEQAGFDKIAAIEEPKVGVRGVLREAAS
jgi:2-polyprenyl-3-methyl-5-hydroxy-6-metoxy-1,4-benzoquinol methylase